MSSRWTQPSHRPISVTTVVTADRLDGGAAGQRERADGGVLGQQGHDAVGQLRWYDDTQVQHVAESAGSWPPGARFVAVTPVR